MTVFKQVFSGAAIVASRLSGRRIPVAVRWNLLNRCTCRCEYCSLWRTPTGEMDTSEVVAVLREFARLGTTMISFSGGEPLLREDIGVLVDAAAAHGISPTMNSSGFGLRRKLDALKHLQGLKLSLDGPEEVHDRARGRKGAWRTVMEAAELATGRIPKVTFATTITRYNVRSFEWLLGVAERFDTMVAFQPVKSLYRGVEDIGSVSPDPEELRSAVADLLAEKRRGNRHIRNSVLELEHMRQWPAWPPLRCSAGHVFVMVQPDGTLVPCDRVAYDEALPTVRQGPLAAAINQLPEVRCDGCAFCGSLELNLLYSLRFGVVADIARFVIARSRGRETSP